MLNNGSTASVLAIGAVIALGLVAQTVSTEILGLVTDSSGAVIPAATVKITRLATGDVRTAATNASGNYVFPVLEIGEYEVTCSASGFKTEVVHHVTIELQQQARLDFRLQVGERAEIVEVSAAGSLLRTEDATMGSVIESRRVVELPLNGRNFSQLATLMPGVIFGTSRIGVTQQGGVPIPGQTVQIAAEGQRDIQQRATIDGVVTTEPRTNTMTYLPSIEAIEEFKVQSAVYSAEYGVNSGAQINVAIKSGTNSLHGTLFEFVRNDKFDARGFFLPPTQTKNKLRRNQYGGVGSGRIKKDRTFWLVNFESRRERRATPDASAVATTAMRSGDFSELLQAGNRWYPSSTAPVLIGLPGSAPFPGNIIPPSLLNPVSLNLLTSKNKSPYSYGGYLPLPTSDAQAFAIHSPINLFGTDPLNVDSNQYLARFDHRFGVNDRVFVHYILVNASAASSPLAVASTTLTDNRSQNVGFGWTKILSPAMVNDLRYGYNRTHTVYGGPLTANGFDQQALGLNFLVNGRPLKSNENGLPIIAISGYLGFPDPREPGQLDNVWLHAISDSIFMNRGRHNIKFGGEYSYNQAGSERANVPRGQLTFTGNISGIPDAFAAFMLGIPYTAQSAEGQPPLTTLQQRLALYWTDDFKATSRLTLNIGVRWDWFGHVHDLDNLGRIRSVSFAPGQAQTINGQFVPELIPNPGTNEPLYAINWKQIMPRLGLAYRLADRMVLRAGAGQFYNANQLNNFQILNLQPPTSGSTINQNNPQNPQATISNPFAGLPPGASPTALLMLGNIGSDGKSHFLNNNIWQWTMEIERTFGKDFVASLGYVGNKGTHLDQTVSNYNNPDPGLGDIQSRRPIQFYTDSLKPGQLFPLSTLRYLNSGLNSNYNALHARVEKRFAHGLTFTAAFNYQKSLATGYSVNESSPYQSNVPQNPRNTALDRGRFGLDQRFRFVYNYVWQLPLFQQAKGIQGAVLGGWSLNGIVQLASGFPITVAQSGDSMNTGSAGAPRPNIAPGSSVSRVWDSRTLSQWFNTAAFVRAKCNGCAGAGLFVGPLGYGNAGEGLIDSPGLKTWDFSLFKEFRIKESHRLQFRIEAFNLFNTPQFAGPDATLGDAAFGRITTTTIDNREVQFALKYSF
jgi:Carboxypeptidase regulatory-like domain/TonB dependent receptor